MRRKLLVSCGGVRNLFERQKEGSILHDSEDNDSICCVRGVKLNAPKNGAENWKEKFVSGLIMVQ